MTEVPIPGSSQAQAALVLALAALILLAVYVKVNEARLANIEEHVYTLEHPVAQMGKTKKPAAATDDGAA